MTIHSVLIDRGAGACETPMRRLGAAPRPAARRHKLHYAQADGMAMPFFETRARVQHPCPFGDLSVAFPTARMALWCNHSGEVLHVEAPDARTKDAVLDAVRAKFGVEAMFEEEGNAFTITRTCACNPTKSVSGVAEGVGVWVLHPITMFGGWETYRILAASQEDLRRFVAGVQKLGTIEVLSHRTRERLEEVHSVDFHPAHLFDGLTDRQVRALLLAYENGLFNVPAEGDLDEIAKREGVARSTFGEHLRKAQQRLVSNAYPFLKLHADAQAARPERAARREDVSVGGK